MKSALLICVLADAALLLAGVRARGAISALRAPFQPATRRLLLPSGVEASGTRYTPPAQFRCALIQYTSTFCPYCDANWQMAALLSRHMAASGCLLITLAPSPGQLPIRQAQPHEIQLAWIEPGWLAQLPRLELEPTSILLGAGGKILWHREGELTPADVTAARNRLHAALP